MIRAANVGKKYKISKKDYFTALQDINFEIKSGTSLAIVGKSGSGKSTLMHILAGLDTPNSGEVLYDEKSLKGMKDSELALFRNHKVGFVFQQFFLLPNVSVIENVALPLKIRGLSRSERNRRAEQALADVYMTDKKHNKAVDLSGGQKQRVCIARAIVTEPEVIFADEPTGNLDSETGEKIINLLFELNKSKKITLIIVTHDEDLANMCQEKLFIKDGRIVKN